MFSLERYLRSSHKVDPFVTVRRPPSEDGLTILMYMSSLAILIPLKDFTEAKGRLRQAGYDGGEIARQLAAAVIAAAAPLPTFVVSENLEVLTFAKLCGAQTLHAPEHGLNASVHFAYKTLSHTFDMIAIVHGDLADPTGLGSFSPGEELTIVSDRDRRGTNVLVVPAGLPFAFHYGVDSRRLHLAEAARLDLSVTEIEGSTWSFDIDDDEDAATLFVRELHS